MTHEQRNEAIIKSLKAYTEKNTVTKEAARSALIAEGIYTQSGKLRVEFGGETAKVKAKKAD